MIIFHEGLPGSGKSYEAMLTRIVPALAKRRAVVAYIEGLDIPKIAGLAKITEDECRELLTVVERHQVQTQVVDEQSGKVVRTEEHLPDLAKPNALMVLDEAQNFWGNRAKLSPALTQFITEHRHQGIDIVLMGQDLRDVHATWRRRVELKMAFLKLNGFGRLFANRYSCTTYRHLGADEFKRVALQVRSYDPRYFGTYKSHVSDETNTEDYSDERGQVLNTPLLRYGMPLAVAAGIWGLWSSYRFFYPAKPDAPAAVVATAPPPRVPVATAAPVVAPRAAAPTPIASAVAPAVVDARSPVERRMADLASRGRIRLAGLATMRDHTTGVIEWVSGNSLVVERLTLDALRTLGVAVVVSGDVVQLGVGDYRELATPWPLEDSGRFTSTMQDQVRGPQRLAAAAPVPQDLAAAAQPSPAPDLPGRMFTQAPAPQPGPGTLQSRIARLAQ